MGKRVLTSAFIAFLVACIPFKSFATENPDSTGLPGDHLNLAAVLDMFKQSSNLEDFEKKLNTKDNHVNNLDLDADGHVDYIRVIDITKGDIHVIALRVPVAVKESQDVAAIEIEKKGNESVQLQIVGDEELYGEKYIVEPTEKTKGDSLEGKWSGFSEQVIFVNVWYWPCVQYIYYPAYIIYVSPWYWGYWPYWWSPWAPYPYYMYYGWNYPYYDYYYCVHEYRMTQAHIYYGPRRVASPIVHQRTEPAHVRYKEQQKNKSKNPPATGTKGNDIPKPDAPRPDANPTTPPPAERPKGNVQPPPPAPRPDVQPQPAPQPKGNVQPAPAPRPKQTGKRPKSHRQKQEKQD